MPNWCVGTLKVRGEKENIRRFLLEGLSPIDTGAAIASMLGKEVEVNTIALDEDEYSLTLKTKEGFHIKGTHRNFIDSREIEWYHDSDSPLIIPDFEAAWGIDTAELASISEFFQIDMKIYAYERGMEFNHDFEVHKGEVIKNDEIKFDDYVWECPEPHRGG